MNGLKHQKEKRGMEHFAGLENDLRATLRNDARGIAQMMRVAIET